MQEETYFVMPHFCDENWCLKLKVDHEQQTRN